MKERTIENYFNREVKRAGGEVRKLSWVGRRHAPDRFVMFPKEGLHALVELKRPGETARPGQLREHERLREAGIYVLVLDTKVSVDAFIVWSQMRP